MHHIQYFRVGHLRRLQKAGGYGVAAGAEFVFESRNLLGQADFLFYHMALAADLDGLGVDEVVEDDVPGGSGHYGLVASLAPGGALKGRHGAVGEYHCDVFGGVHSGF